MTIIVDTGDRFLPILNQILSTIKNMESKMGQLDADIADLSTTVGSIATELTAVLKQLQNGNITPDQVANLEQQIAGLHDIKAQLDAVQPAPAPQPTPTPDQPPAPDVTPPANVQNARRGQ